MSAYRHLPNVVSALRLATVPLLAWLAYAGHERAFTWILLIAGMSDMLDGWMARRFGWESRVGAMLDSAADISIVLVVLFAIIRLRAEVFVSEGWVIWSILAVWSAVNLIALARYRRLASFHTAFGRVGLMMFGVFVLVLLFYGYVPWVLYVCGSICFLAGVESLALVVIVEEWTPNLRGGLRAVLANRK